MSDSMYTEICHNKYFELLKPNFEHMEGKYCVTWKGQFEKWLFAQSDKLAIKSFKKDYNNRIPVKNNQRKEISF